MRVYVIIANDIDGRFIRICGIYENYKHAELARASFIQEDAYMSDELNCDPFIFTISEHILWR